MKLPFARQRAALGCPTCNGAGKVVMTAFAMTEGKKLVARTCPSCRGKGTLKRR